MRKGAGREFVVIGAGAAGLSAVREIADRGGEVALISCESPPILYRPLLPYLLKGRVKRERLFIPEGLLHGVELLEGKMVEVVEPRRRLLRFKDGTEMGYGSLLLATGAEPVAPGIEGLEGDGVFFFNSLTDIDDLGAFLKKGDVKAAAVLGGGFIGTAAASALKSCHLRVTIVEILERLLSQMLDPMTSRMAERLLISEGIDIVKGRRAVRISRRGDGIESILLDDGESIPCQMVVLAAGIRPAIPEFRGQCPLVGDGLIVDERLETSIPGIFAAGDVAEVTDRVLGERRVIPNWSNAREQGGVAGRNMTGGREVYDGGVVMNSIRVGDAIFISMGKVDRSSGDEIREFLEGDERRGVVRKILTYRGTIKGALFVNDLTFAGTINDLMKRRVDTSGIEAEILKGGKGFVDLLLDSRREEMEGDLEWTGEAWMKDRFEKRVDEKTWKGRG